MPCRQRPWAGPPTHEMRNKRLSRTITHVSLPTPLFAAAEVMYSASKSAARSCRLAWAPATAHWRRCGAAAVDVARGGEGIREQIVRETLLLLERAGVERGQVRGVGVGFGGPVDDADQTIIKVAPDRRVGRLPASEVVDGPARWPVALGNDADVRGWPRRCSGR